MIGLLNELGRAWLSYSGLALLQNTIFLGLIFIILDRMRHASAELRYSVGLVGLIKLLLPPFLALPAVVIPVREPTLLSGTLANLPFSFLTLDSAATAPPTSVGLQIPGLLLLVWAVGFLTFLSLPLVATMRLSHRLWDAAPVTTDGAHDLVRDKRIQVFICASICVPLTVWLHPRRIYVPAAWQAWSTERRRQVLRHEIAHIQRRDGLVQIVQYTARALYFFHPLVLLLNRRLGQYREMACDDTVVRAGEITSLQYVRHLIAIAEQAVLPPESCEAATGMMWRKSELLARAQYQVKETGMRRISKATGIGLLLAAALLILPFSWYRGETETGLAVAGEETLRTDQERVTGRATVASDPLKVSIWLTGDDETKVDGEMVDLMWLSEFLDRVAATKPRDTVIQISCDEDVTMGTLHRFQKMLMERQLTKVSFLTSAGRGLPLVLPPQQALDRLAEIPSEHLATVRLGPSEKLTLDGQELTREILRNKLAKRVAADKLLVVVIRTDPATPYDHFATTLEMAKKAGAQRIAVNPELASE